MARQYLFTDQLARGVVQGQTIVLACQRGTAGGLYLPELPGSGWQKLNFTEKARAGFRRVEFGKYWKAHAAAPVCENIWPGFDVMVTTHAEIIDEMPPAKPAKLPRVIVCPGDRYRLSADGPIYTSEVAHRFRARAIIVQRANPYAGRSISKIYFGENKLFDSEPIELLQERDRTFRPAGRIRYPEYIFDPNHARKFAKAFDETVDHRKKAKFEVKFDFDPKVFSDLGAEVHKELTRAIQLEQDKACYNAIYGVPPRPKPDGYDRKTWLKMTPSQQKVALNSNFGFRSHDNDALDAAALTDPPYGFRWTRTPSEASRRAWDAFYRGGWPALSPEEMAEIRDTVYRVPPGTSPFTSPTEKTMPITPFEMPERKAEPRIVDTPAAAAIRPLLEDRQRIAENAAAARDSHNAEADGKLRQAERLRADADYQQTVVDKAQAEIAELQANIDMLNGVAGAATDKPSQKSSDGRIPTEIVR